MTDYLTNEWGNGVRIAAVETAVIEGNFDWILVRVTTDDGSSGLGEAYWGAGVLELIEAASAFIISKNPFDVARIIFELQRCLSGAGSQAGATVTAISGIELALWDLVARALDTPLSTLFGGRFRDRIRLYVDLHAGEEPTPESWAIRARDALARGFSAVKFDLDAPNPYRASSAENTDPWRLWYEPYNRTMSAAERRFIVDVVSAVRAAIGPDTDLALDCHWKYTVSDAIALAHALEPLLPVWLEDPVPPDNVDALRAVARSTRIPICTGENHYRLAGFRELILRQACHYVAPDIPKMGGLLEARNVAALAELYGLLVVPHNVASPIGAMAAAQLCAAIPNFFALEFHAFDRAWWEELVFERPLIQNGHLVLPNRPGHGLMLNVDVARAHAKRGTTFFGEPV
jgi:L-alanine-DL-glutamate epimerase-like enolase superfamily enzyme